MKSRVVIVLISAASLCMLLEQAAWAQRGGRGRGGRGGGAFAGGGGFGRGGFGQRGGALWSREDVQSELKLSDEQKSKLADMGESQRERQREMFQNFREMSDEERSAAQEELRDETKKELAQILGAPQLDRLNQIELQQEGPSALARDEVAEQMSLSDEQKSKVKAIIEEATDESSKLREEMQGAFRGGFGGGGGGFDRDQMRQQIEQMRERTDQVNKQRDERLLAVLTEDQSDKWQGMLGAAFALQEDEVGGGGFRGAGGGGFGGRGRGAARVRPAADEPAQAEVDAETGEKLIRFNFRYHPWDEVLDWFAQQADVSLNADMKPTGTCNYTDPTAYKPDEALDRLNELLITKGFILIRKDKTLFCWYLQNPIPPSLVPEVRPEDLDQHGQNSMVTVKLFLERLLADETAEQLQDLKGPFGTVTALPAVNLLVITDTAGNVRRIRDVLFGVDQSGGEGALRTFQLRHTQAKEVANQVRQLLGLPVEEDEEEASSSPWDRRRSRGGDWRQLVEMQRRMQRGGGAAPVEPEARVVADTRLNRVLVAAPPDDLARAARAIEELDQPVGFGDPTLAPQLDRYVLRRSDPDTVVSLLQQALGEGSAVQLTADRSTGSIWVFASMSQQQMIRNIINQMEGTQGGMFGGEGQRMFNVGGLDAEQLTEVLRALWQQSGGENQIILAPGAGQSSTSRPAGSSRVFTPQSLRWERQRESRQAQFERRRRAREAEAARPQAEEEATPTEVKPTSGQATPRVDPKPRIPAAATQAAGVERGADAPVSYVSVQQEAIEGTDEQEEAAGEPGQEPETAGPPQGAAQETPAKPPVIIRLENGVLTVQSEDKEALERIERLLSAIVPSGNAQAPFYVAPLHEAEVTEVKATIDQVLTGATISTGTFSTEIVTTAAPRIIADERTNSLLIVGASAAQRATIDQLISVLDTSDLPENALSRQPQLIPVENTSAVEVAEVVRDVFADHLQGNNARGGNDRSNDQDPRSFFLAQFGQRGRNGRNGRSNGRTQQSASRSTAGRMTLGVDERTNTIVVSAPEALFEQVEDLVKQLDEAAETSNRSIRLVPVQLSNVSAAQQTLSVLLGNGSGQSSGNGGRQATNRGPTGFQGFQGFGRPQRSQGNTGFGGRANRNFGGFNGFTGRGGENGGNFSRRRGGGDNGGRGGDRGRRGGFRGGND